MSGFEIVKRVLGVDYGRARIGIAISDELGMLAHALETIPASDIKAASKRIAEIARAREVECVVLGMPRRMDGIMGTAATEVTDFAEKLRLLLPCKLVTWDERLTTTAANRALRNAGQKTRQTRGIVDQVAAQIILQGYLDRAQTARDAAVLPEAPLPD